MFLGCLCTCIYGRICYDTFITNRCALLWLGMIMAIIFTIKMKDDHDLSYDSNRLYISLAQLIILTHCNWTHGVCLYQDWSRLIQLGGGGTMQRAALSNDAVRSDTIITNNYNWKLNLWIVEIFWQSKNDLRLTRLARHGMEYL